MNQLSFSKLVMRLVEISWIGLSNFSERVSMCSFPGRVCYSFWRNASSLNPLLEHKQTHTLDTIRIGNEIITPKEEN